MNSHPKNSTSYITDLFDRIHQSDCLKGFSSIIKLNEFESCLKTHLKEVLCLDQKLSCQIILWWLSRETERLKRFPDFTQSPRMGEDGIWALPNGDAYYAFLLKEYTTLRPEEIHKIGIEEVDRIEKKIIDLLKEQELWKEESSVGEYLQELNKNPAFFFSNTEEGRDLCLKKFKEIVSRAEEKLGTLFSAKPKEPPLIKLVPFGEKGDGPACYDRSKDGGTCFLDLSDPQKLPLFQMETIAIHEGIPGHHYQRRLQIESDTHILQKEFYNAAYVEGWALYAETLAYEEGFYSSFSSQIGHLQSELRRAARLVVDTGIHLKRWSFGKAIDYMGRVVGLSESVVVEEITKCFHKPGQPCAYKLGQMKILELREEEKRRLGDQFDLKEFHGYILNRGVVPLSML